MSYAFSAAPKPARQLGLAGLIPFAVFALAAVFAPALWADPARAILANYGAVILSFMGGCRWGFAAAGLGEGPAMRPLALSVAPSLWAWVALSAQPPFDMLMLAAGFAALLGSDIALTKIGGAPAWWPGLRWPLTLGAAAACLAGAVA
jgi:hypothetical protein